MYEEKPGINSYKKAYQACEKALEIKKVATSAQLLDWVLLNYNINNLNLTPKGITYYLKDKGYFRKKKHESKPWIFYFEKQN